MSNPWTPLHAALTLSKGPLAYEHIVQAVSAGVVEEAGLDWKQELPQRGNVDETTKDIAAMANSGGGIIIYGVAESSGRAESVSHVSVVEADRSMILAAAAQAHPMVQGMELHALPGSEGSVEGVVVAIVPGSPNAPHMVGQKHLYGAPVRNGPTTVWLDERAIERAYSERFNLRSSRNSLMVAMADDLRDRLSLINGETWLVGVATPLAPLSRQSDLSRSEASELLNLGEAHSRKMIGKAAEFSWALGEVESLPELLRVGRRRWVAETIYRDGPDSRSEDVHAELHHDGSIGLAIKTNPAYETVRFTRPTVPLDKESYKEILDVAVETFAADIVSLTYEAMQKCQNAGTFSLRIEAAREGKAPFVLIGLDHGRPSWFIGDEVGQDPKGRTIPRFHPVESEIRPSDTEEDLVGIARSLALEIVEQFGTQSLHYLALPTTT